MASKNSKEKWSSVTAQVRLPDHPVWSFVGRGHNWRSLCPLRVESGGKTVKRVAVENPLSRGGHTRFDGLSKHTSAAQTNERVGWGGGVGGGGWGVGGGVGCS